jgi:indole-3-glycerol phosphate synthase
VARGGAEGKDVSGVLDGILEAKRREIEALQSRAPTLTDRIPHDPIAALRRGAGEPVRIVAEIKRKSPSAGALSTALSPAARAVAYARSGAAMISVLCDGPFFDGAWEHVAEARAALDDERVALPVLAKEFVLDEVQIAEARERGADAILLIARIVSRARLAELVSATRDMGLEPVVEIVTDDELAAAVAANATLIGVNARDLDSLAMDAARAARLLAAIPAPCVALHLSGIKTAADVAALPPAVHAALVGEALMRLDDPSPLLRSLSRPQES